MGENIGITTEQKALLALLGKSLFSAPFCISDDVDTDVLAELIKAQNIEGLVYEGIKDSSEAGLEALACQIESGAVRTVLKNFRLLYDSKQISLAMKKEGIDAIVLKGAVASRMYPVPEARKSGDIDILIRDKNQFYLASRVLTALGYEEGELKTNDKEFVSQAGYSVELHIALNKPFNEKCDSLIAQIEKIGLENAEELVLFDDISVLALQAPVRGFHYILHMIHHFLEKGFGVRLLCDFAMFLYSECDENIASQLKSWLEDCGFLYFAKCAATVANRYMGLPEAKTYGFILSEDESEGVRDFIEEMFSAGEFGLNDSNRMVVLKKRGPLGLVAEFHRQMRFNHPKASRCFLTWPVLYIVTLVVFLRNNKKRGTTAGAIIKNASKRGNRLSALRLFK